MNSLFSAAEQCERRYGFYTTGLLLEVNERTGVVKIKPNSVNYTLVVAHLYPNIRYSIFERTIFDGNQRLTNDNILVMRNELVRFFGVQISKESAEEAIRVAALERKFNPLQDYFTGLEYRGTSHLDTWLIDVCGAEDTPINRVIGRKFLISAVARGVKPGCYVEGSLIFFGKTAAGKSWLIENLNPFREFYCGSNINIGSNRDASQGYAGKFIVEFSELSQIRKSSLEDVKRFLTEAVDTFVPKYSNFSENVPRMMVFAGSTNEPNILVDTTGNRRFWAVEVGEISKTRLMAIKADLWAEAYKAFSDGDGKTENWVLTDEERDMLDKSNSSFEADDPLTDYLGQTLREFPEGEIFRPAQLLEIARRHDPRAHQNAVTRSMLSLGYKRQQITSGPNKGSMGYSAPSENNWN